jgi:hypothetical protein
MKEPIEAPTRQQLRDEVGFKIVQSDLDDDCYCGDTTVAIYVRESDGTYWQARYNISSDGFINDLEGGEYCQPVEVTQVKPELVTTIKYTAISQTNRRS